jgi:Anti-sigma-K factor rskA
VKAPDFDELIGPDVSAEERERLRQAHDALVAAGPPPELPPSLARPPGSSPPKGVPAPPRLFPRRRLAAGLVLAAALALAAFGAGYFTGDSGGDQEGFERDFVLRMEGTTAAPNALASLVVGKKDDDGNWPMLMTVLRLEPLPAGKRYELVLTKAGERAVSCGTFTIDDEQTVVYLNAPYRLKAYDGWAITREGSDELLVRTDRV